MKSLFALLIIFQAKHFVADYPLQAFPIFLGKFRKDFVDAAGPLALHCLVHAALTFSITLYWSGAAGLALLLAGLDFTVHFWMDRLKASPNLLGRWKGLSAREYPTASAAEKRGNILFWNAIGIDQLVHHCTHYAIIWVLIHN